MTDKEWVEGAVKSLEWTNARSFENKDLVDPARRWVVWADDEDGYPRLLAGARSQAKAWAAAKEALEPRMRKEIGWALRLKDFLDRVAAGW